ncbi:autotransporter outer membrane beta-barrel domain-containing protein [Serratia sp. M24T3]|uniref:autotransporter outer membrane beta-barrel domain-containing protein n=1 Tax=Serratia sp. M24T3 TaxID=932213 RepID=UPI00025B8ED7|nr:autotransporter outer membrane beta-barrel domain-containing protein [Serratia sp. M24T3]EIC84607.1 outer membrane autotransporter [Serratia sp. M24T3]
MRNVMRLSKLSQCILLATSSLIIAGNASAATPVLKLSEQASGLTQTKSGAHGETEWNLDHLNGNAAVLAKNAENHNVYFSGPNVAGTRTAKDKQELVVAGTDLSGHYINMSKGGTANLYLLPGSKVDMVEIGDNGAKTDTTIVLNNAQLSGQQASVKYDDKPAIAKVPNKDYMDGAAIWMDPKDNGNLNVIADNGSVINGSIIARGTGNKNIELNNSIMAHGDISIDGQSINNVLLKNTALNAKANVVDQKNLGTNPNAIVLTNSVQNNVFMDHSNVEGIKILTSKGDSNILILNKSHDNGNILIQADGKANLDINNSTHQGNIDISGKKGAAVYIADGAQAAGNITFGEGDNQLIVKNNSALSGFVDGSAGNTVMTVGDSSYYNGNIFHVKSLTLGDKALVATEELRNMRVDMTGHDTLITNTLANSTVTMSSSDQLSAKTAAGSSTLTINKLSADTTAGTHELAEMTLAKKAMVNATFSNGKQTVSARNGAYNYELQLSDGAFADYSVNGVAQQKIVLDVKQADLVNDVKGAIAGLDGAKQSATAVTSSIANRMNTLNASNLFNGVHEGASVWGDYLYQDADLKGNVTSNTKLQGLNTGADWTWKLSNGDSLTSGISLARVKDKLSNASASGDYNNHVTGNFYSLYGGWQQALQNKTWSLFTNANLSYGDLSYSANSNNVGASTSGIKDHLNSNYKGKVLNGEVRSGVNIKATETILVQPYALLGMNKATSDEFANKTINFSKNQSGSWYAGIGTRVTANVEVKSVKLMPWADVSYTQEFADKTDISASSVTKSNDLHLTSGKMRKVVSAGAGVNAAVTNNLNLNSGIYTSAGDTNKDVSVRLGVNYNF